MSDLNTSDSFVEMFVFETAQNVEQLEMIVLNSEKAKHYSKDALNEIFRLVHTIKGSSAMMLYNNISSIGHKIEDLFHYIREREHLEYDSSALSDLVLSVIDYIKVELEKLKAGNEPDGDSSELAEEITKYLSNIKTQNNRASETIVTSSSDKKVITLEEKEGFNSYEAVFFFEDGCQMENIRAFDVVHKLNNFAVDISHIPEELIESDHSAENIVKNGFKVYFKTEKSYEEVQKLLLQTLFLKELILKEIVSSKDEKKNESKEDTKQTQKTETNVSEAQVSIASSIISVNIEKLDKLLDLAGEMVIAEAMLTHNPDLLNLELPNFSKSAQHFRKIINELQDLIMSTRMVPLTISFQKMNRVVHDMNKKLNKETRLILVGEDTEVDKNIIEHISDPLMHLVRNSIDHGIEQAEERIKKGKSEYGTITLEARNEGSDVLIIVKDDGKGFNKKRILEHAKEKNLLYKSAEEMTDKEIFSLIFIPGFSTKDNITEFSGRGVGMDVVMNNIQEIGGVVNVESTIDEGSTITIKIPLTLAIITGMNVKVGNSIYTVPIKEIKESFRPNKEDIVIDPAGNELILVRGECYPIFRIHKKFGVDSEITDFEDGIFVIVENDNRNVCLFVDELLGQQQVVVKALPSYITNIRKISCVAGCTLLGDGSISLIINVSDLLKLNI